MQIRGKYSASSKKRRISLRTVSVSLAAAIVIGGCGYYGFSIFEKQKSDFENTGLLSSIEQSADTLDNAQKSASSTLSSAYSKVQSETSAAAKKQAEEAKQAAAKKQAEAKKNSVGLSVTKTSAKTIKKTAATQKKAAAAKSSAQKKAAAQTAATKKKWAANQQKLKAATTASKTAASVAAEKKTAAAEQKQKVSLSSLLNAQAQNAVNETIQYCDEAPTPTVDLAVPSILQKPSLPNGCEVTSLAEVINWMGIPVDKTTLSDNYLPQFPFYQIASGKTTRRAGGDPELYFCGNPRSTSNAYYCFSAPIVTAANNFFTANDSSHVAYDLSGANESQLIDQLNMGYPVIVWGTLSMGDAYRYAPSSWVIENEGVSHIPFINLHCVVLYGYDDNYFLIADPLRGNVAYRRSTFMNAYQQIGSRAVVIY